MKGAKMSIVLDPFSGAGTTATVCRELNRDFIVIDINPKSAELLGLEPCTDYHNPLNQIFIGDNLEIMLKLYEIHGSFIDLIYADPPFGRNSVDRQFGIDWRTYPSDGLPELFGGVILKGMGREARAYTQWLMPRLEIMHKLLKDTGSLYLHCDSKG